MIKLHKTIYDEKEVRSQFPIFNSGNLVYLDSAASSQKPFSVIKSINEVYSKHYANIHRGVYKLSQEATDMYEDARETVKEFINAGSVKEIIFVRGATEAINLVTSTVAEINIEEGAFIGAGAVVTKDVKKNEVVTGNPAKFLKNIKHKFDLSFFK